MNEGKIKCLECGKFFTRPLSHVWQVHEMSAREYKKKHGLDLKKGLTTEDYRQVMRDHVMNNGTINNLKKGSQFRFKKGHSQNYIRSAQTQERLKKHWLIVSNLKGRPVHVEKIEIKCALCGKTKKIYPREYRKNNNYCGVVCRNIANNKKSHEKNR